MKSNLIKCLCVALFMASFSMDAEAQKNFSKIDKAWNKANSSLKYVNSKLEGGNDALNAETTSSSDTSSVASGAVSLLSAILDDPQYTVLPTYQIDDKGDTIRNEDGTKQLTYIVYDKDGKACDPNYVSKLVDVRLSEFGKVLKKVGVSSAVGAVGGFLSGGKKGIGKGALVGAGTGLISSADNIAKITALNKSMSAYKKVISAYQQTFTEAGLPIDATADLSNVNGIDFTKDEPITKSSAEIAQELSDSKSAIASLEEIDLLSL